MPDCVAVDDCPDPAAYLLEYEDDGEFAACTRHTAELRAHDPLEYIVAVRSLPREASHGEH